MQEKCRESAECPHLDDKVLVSPLLRRLGSLLLLERNVSAALNLAANQHVAISIFEKVALGFQKTQRVLQLVWQDQLQITLRQLVLAELAAAQLVNINLGVAIRVLCLLGKGAARITVLDLLRNILDALLLRPARLHGSAVLGQLLLFLSALDAVSLRLGFALGALDGRLIVVFDSALETFPLRVFLPLGHVGPFVGGVGFGGGPEDALLAHTFSLLCVEALLLGLECLLAFSV